jgi:hypothetical protein
VTERGVLREPRLHRIGIVGRFGDVDEQEGAPLLAVAPRARVHGLRVVGVVELRGRRDAEDVEQAHIVERVHAALGGLGSDEILGTRSVAIVALGGWGQHLGAYRRLGQPEGIRAWSLERDRRVLIETRSAPAEEHTERAVGELNRRAGEERPHLLGRGKIVRGRADRAFHHGSERGEARDRFRVSERGWDADDRRAARAVRIDVHLERRVRRRDRTGRLHADRSGRVRTRSGLRRRGQSCKLFAIELHEARRCVHHAERVRPRALVEGEVPVRLRLDDRRSSVADLDLRDGEVEKLFLLQDIVGIDR